jgi:hypothetical protein
MNSFSSPSDYLEFVRDRFSSIAKRHRQDDAFDDRKELRALFPYLAKFASGQSMYPPRVSMRSGYGIESFVMYLASRCDGAVTRDGRGFDQADSNEGHRLSAKLSASSRLALTATEREWALERCFKYRQQLSARYGDEYEAVMEYGRFLFDPAPEGQSDFVQHLRFNEEGRSVSFSLPSLVSPRERDAVMREAWALVNHTGVRLTSSFAELGSRLRTDWERHRYDFTFLQSQAGGRDLVDILEKLGYTKDERIDAALASDVSAYLRVAVSPGVGYEGKMLVGFLHCIFDGDELMTEVSDFYASLAEDGLSAGMAVNLSKRNGHRILRFPIGDMVAPQLEGIMGKHGVQNVESIGTALDDPKRASYQHPDLVVASPSAAIATPTLF